MSDSKTEAQGAPKSEARTLLDGRYEVRREIARSERSVVGGFPRGLA